MIQNHCSRRHIHRQTQKLDPIRARPAELCGGAAGPLEPAVRRRGPSAGVRVLFGGGRDP